MNSILHLFFISILSGLNRSDQNETVRRMFSWFL